MKHVENYQALRERLALANDKQALDRLEQQATRIYNADQLTVSQLKRIDVAIMEKLAKIA